MRKNFLNIFLCLFVGQVLLAQDLGFDEDQSEFPGRVSKINPVAKLMRVRVTFDNMKFVNKGEKLQFWQHLFPDNKCRGEVVARSQMYFLLKIPRYQECIKRVNMTTGSSLRFYGEDLSKNLRTAKELVDILLKKRLALHSKVLREAAAVEKYNEKIEIVNKRYETLYRKLEAERLKEMEHLKNDQITLFETYKETEGRFRDVMRKLEKYRVEDNNFQLDRWALDPKLYFMK